MSSSDSYSEYVDAVNYCLSQARSLQLNETNSIGISLATNTTKPSSSTTQQTGVTRFGTTTYVMVSFLAPSSYSVGAIWLDCSPLWDGSLPVFKVCLTVLPAASRWWPLDSLSSVYNNSLAIQQGIAATAGAPAIPGLYVREAFVVAFNGQTAFSLSATPSAANQLNLEINGVAYNNPTSFTLAGTTVTWLNTFTLRTTDSVYAIYA